MQRYCSCLVQVNSVMDAMPAQNLKPANEEEALDENRLYRTTYMFSATMPPAVSLVEGLPYFNPPQKQLSLLMVSPRSVLTSEF